MYRSITSVDVGQRVVNTEHVISPTMNVFVIWDGREATVPSIVVVMVIVLVSTQLVSVIFVKVHAFFLFN